MLRPAAEVIAPWGYDAINLNCGCRATGWRARAASARRRREPDLVADCCAALADGAGADCGLGQVPHRRDERPRARRSWTSRCTPSCATLCGASPSAAASSTVCTRGAPCWATSRRRQRKVPPLAPRWCTGWRRTSPRCASLQWRARDARRPPRPPARRLAPRRRDGRPRRRGAAVALGGRHGPLRRGGGPGAKPTAGAARVQAIAEAQEAALRSASASSSRPPQPLAAEPNGKKFCAASTAAPSSRSSRSATSCSARRRSLLPETLSAPAVYDLHSKSYAPGPTTPPPRSSSAAEAAAA